MLPLNTADKIMFFDRVGSDKTHIKKENAQVYCFYCMSIQLSCPK